MRSEPFSRSKRSVRSQRNTAFCSIPMRFRHTVSCRSMLTSYHIDMLSSSGHKLNGPKGIGFPYTSAKALRSVLSIHGGAQERKRRAGTENVPGIVGLWQGSRASQHCHHGSAYCKRDRETERSPDRPCFKGSSVHQTERPQNHTVCRTTQTSVSSL